MSDKWSFCALFWCFWGARIVYYPQTTLEFLSGSLGPSVGMSYVDVQLLLQLWFVCLDISEDHFEFYSLPLMSWWIYGFGSQNWWLPLCHHYASLSLRNGREMLSALSATTLWTFTHLNCFVCLGLLIGLGFMVVFVLINCASQFVLAAKWGSLFLVAFRAS